MDTALNIASQHSSDRSIVLRDRIASLLEHGFREVHEALEDAPVCSFGSLSTRNPITGFLRGAIL